MADVNTFAGYPLDRAAERRTDTEWLARSIVAEGSRFLPLWRAKLLVRVGAPGLAWARTELRTRAPQAVPLFLGLRDDVAHFALDVSGLEEPENELGVTGLAEFREARAAALELPSDDAAIGGLARALHSWHASHAFCGACGRATHAERAGWMRRCEACAREHFPRTDPVVIALVTHGDRCLLGRQPGWPARMFSALAGFVEPGETIEEAVRREILEEAGIHVGAVRYHATQPWPFPHSLMIGCMAEALTEGIRLGDDELAEARWVSRAEARAALAGSSRATLALPQPIAIAHHLIRAFVDGH